MRNEIVKHGSDGCRVGADEGRGCLRLLLEVHSSPYQLQFATLLTDICIVTSYPLSRTSSIATRFGFLVPSFPRVFKASGIN